MTHLPKPRRARPRIGARPDTWSDTWSDTQADARPGTRPRARSGSRRRVGGAFALLLAASLAVAGCSATGSSNDSAASSGKDAAAPARLPDQAGSGSKDAGGATRNDTGGSPNTRVQPPAATYLIRTADLTVRTRHVADALDKARTLVADAGGYAGDEDTSLDSAGHEESTIQLRVPPAAYDRLLTDLGALGTLLDRKVSVQDVTGKVVDVQSRITSQQASLTRVRLLMDRAGKLSDVVALEGELSTREADLESLQAQQASLKAQTDLATVTLRLTEPPVRPAPPQKAKHDGFWTSVGHALGDGWHAFYLAIRGVLIALSVLLPFLVVALLAWFGYRLARRWWPRTIPAPTLPQPPRRAPAEAAEERATPEKEEPPVG